MKKKKIILVLIMGMIISGIVLMYKSFALFSVNQINRSVITIKVGTMNGTIKVNQNATDSLTINANETKEFTVTLENTNRIAGKFLFYYQQELPNGLTIGYQVATDIDIPPDTMGTVLSSNETQTYSIKVSNKTSSSQTITLKTTGGLENLGLSLPTDAHIIEQYVGNNFADVIIEKANDKTITSYINGNQGEVYTFIHEKGVQQEGWTTDELTSYRYIGATPNNYVYFNCKDSSDKNTCELWRVVGVFSVENEKGEKQQRVKIMRNNSLGIYVYDNKKQGEGSALYSYGSSEWKDAHLNTLLNDTYYDQKQGSCYITTAAQTATTCDFTSLGLTKNARTMIEKAKFYLGSITNQSSVTDSSTENVYLQERGTAVQNTNQSTNYLSNIGLIYPSDYGYTYSLGVSNTIYNTLIASKGTSGFANGWMYSILTNNGANFAWTMSPMGVISSRNDITPLGNDGRIYYSTGRAFPNIAYLVTPSTYLKKDVQVISGSGSSTDPYILG